MTPVANQYAMRDPRTQYPQPKCIETTVSQLGGIDILVNGVAPGPVWTPLQTSGGQPQAKIPNLGISAPMKRPGQPAELAPIYVLLASQESSFVTGEIYGVTGGMHLP